MNRNDRRPCVLITWRVYRSSARASRQSGMMPPLGSRPKARRQPGELRLKVFHAREVRPSEDTDAGRQFARRQQNRQDTLAPAHGVFMLSQQRPEVGPAIPHPGRGQHQEYVAAGIHNLLDVDELRRTDAEIALVATFSPTFDRRGISHSRTHSASAWL